MTFVVYDRRTVVRRSGAALAVIGTAECLNGQSSADRTVTMPGDFGFDPETATIESGQIVTWVNSSDGDHTVTASEDEIPDAAAYFASGGFESERAARTHVRGGLVAPDGEYEDTFETPGVYEYYCIPHESPGMVGTIRVEWCGCFPEKSVPVLTTTGPCCGSMDLQIRGLNDLEEKLRAAVDRLGELQAGTRVSSDEFFSDPFMSEHTQFDSFSAFCEESPWSLAEPRHISRVDDRRLDAYVAETTDFESWEVMKTQAAEEEIVDQVVSDPS